MRKPPTRATAEGRVYLDLRALAKQTGRPTDELLQLHALEAFLARWTLSEYAQKLVLKGGMMLAVFDARRPTRDIDLATCELRNDEATALAVVRDVLGIELDDGLTFDLNLLETELIRDDDLYSGLRVTVHGGLASAKIQFHVDLSFGDPIWPEPGPVRVPRLLGGEDLTVPGYPLTMILAEKIVTALQRGSANTRWRDFVDIRGLSLRHAVDGSELRGAIERVARHRETDLKPLSGVLDGFGEIAQPKWKPWRRKQGLQATTPEAFHHLLEEVLAFTEPPLGEPDFALSWDPESRIWIRVGLPPSTGARGGDGPSSGVRPD